MTRRLKKTHELLAKLFSRVPSLKDELASPFRVEKDLITAWARPKASDENLYGTGKGNPLDRVEKLLSEAHAYDPDMTREIAEHFPRFVDELDRRAGFDECEDGEQPCRAIARVAEGHLQLIVAGLGNCDDPRKMSEVLAKTQALKSYVIQLEGCVKGILKSEE